MKHLFITLTLCTLLSQKGFTQTNIVNDASGNWNPLIKLSNFDPNDDQQSNADTDFVGNATYAIMETQNETVSFTDGITDEVYYFRVRMGSSNPNTSFYFGLDVTGDLIADLFVEANVKSQTPYVSYHLRDYSKSGISPSQTAWLNGSHKGELELTNRDAAISDYSAGTDLDGGNSGIDYWIEFGFTEESIKAYVLNELSLSITGDSIIALYGFTSTSQTSNGDIMGVDDNNSSELDKSWEELDVIISGTLNSISSGVVVTPTIDTLTTEDTTPTLTGTWGSDMLGGDTLTVTVNNVDYTTNNGLVIDNLNWSLPISTALDYGTYNVVASAYRSSDNQTVNDTTSDELTILPPGSGSGGESSSGNNGGLESNGNLASLIASNNFKRATSGTQKNKKQTQAKFNKNNVTQNSIENYLPTTGYHGTEKALVSSPNDLLDITNANEITSIDYYEGSNRVAVAFATKTTGRIYSHSKMVCDRLNNASLEDAWVFSLSGHQIIGSKIKRDSKTIEYTLSFSIKLENNSNELLSFWNVSQYPKGNFYNFQIWGNSFLQVFSIANHVINTISNEKTLHSTPQEDIIPQTFVRSGHYSNGKIHLNIMNKAGAQSATIEGYSSSTETALVRQHLSKTIDLTGTLYETISIETDRLFDVGFELKLDTSSQSDALYLADGPWGLDYINDLATIDTFNIENNPISSTKEAFTIERQPRITGQVKGTLNLFRNILPGDQTFTIRNYNALQFSIKNTQDVELVLMNSTLGDWNNRLRFTIPPNTTATNYNILFSQFKNNQGITQELGDIKTIVFSIIGNYTTFTPFEIQINNLAITNSHSLNTTNTFANSTKVINHPNPFVTTTTIVLHQPSKYIDIVVFDVLGRVIDKKQLLVNHNTITYKAPDNTAKGIYKYILTDDIGTSYSGTFLMMSSI